MSAICDLAYFDRLLFLHTTDIGIVRNLDTEADVWNLLVSTMRWCDLVGLDYERVSEEARNFHRNNPIEFSPVAVFEEDAPALACA